jgi:AraC-like DNA-binding protein
MPRSNAKHLYLPERDRSFWKGDSEQNLSLLYLAWGYRDFKRQPIPASCHEGWVCVLIEEGCPTMRVANRSLPMPAGTLALIGPDCPFGWRGSTAGPSKFRLWMWRTFAAAKGHAELNAGYVTRMLNRKDRKPFVLLHELCRQEVLHPASPGKSYLEGCHMIFEATMRREIENQPKAMQQASELIELAQAWMSAHLESKEPVARLCDYLNLSQSTLYRLFMAELQTSPLACFHQLRMQKANQLLASSDLPIKEIAFQLGYQHFNDLSRAYRGHYGHSPSESRERLA